MRAEALIALVGLAGIAGSPGCDLDSPDKVSSSGASSVEDVSWLLEPEGSGLQTTLFYSYLFLLFWQARNMQS